MEYQASPGAAASKAKSGHIYTHITRLDWIAPFFARRRASLTCMLRFPDAADKVGVLHVVLQMLDLNVSEARVLQVARRRLNAPHRAEAVAAA